ncbi:MAG: hypothetical protein LBT41_03790 [Candidatus Methanoplasma sp.]|jgi:hypothetical protein|nr:hypothetical protein [Candidatus Methanoplasma sp.]
MHVPAGQNIALIGTPLSGYQFEKWNDGADDIFHNPITVSAAGSRTVSFIDASAPDNGYIVDAAAGANGSFGYERYAETPTGTYVSGILGAAAIRVPAGQNIALLGTPLSGYQFEKWNDGADDIFHNPITVSAAGSRTVSFSDPSSPSNGYNVDVTAGANGSFGYETYVGTPTGTYVTGFTGAVTIHVPSDRNISLAAIADAGYRFVKWQKDGVDYSTTAVIDLASADAGVYEASFTEAALSATYTISAYADGGSEITPSGSVIIAAGKNATFTFTAKEGYAIADVIVDGASVPTAAASGEYTFYNVGSNHTVSIISEISVPTPGGGGDDAENNPAGNGALSDAAVAAAVVAIAAVAVAAGAAILWFAFGPGRTFEVIKIPSGALIIGRDRAYYGKAYNFETDGGANVRYRIGKDETWKEPIRTHDGYEIPKEEVTGTVTIEVD